MPSRFEYGPDTPPVPDAMQSPIAPPMRIPGTRAACAGSHGCCPPRRAGKGRAMPNRDPRIGAPSATGRLRLTRGKRLRDRVVSRTCGACATVRPAPSPCRDGAVPAAALETSAAAANPGTGSRSGQAHAGRDRRRSSVRSGRAGVLTPEVRHRCRPCRERRSGAHCPLPCWPVRTGAESDGGARRSGGGSPRDALRPPVAETGGRARFGPRAAHECKGTG